MWKLHNIQLKKVTRVMIQPPGDDNAVMYDINSLASLADHPDLHICIYMPVMQENKETDGQHHADSMTVPW
ncbi:hypothetical protein D3C81_1841890 [compost metagenome]